MINTNLIIRKPKKIIPETTTDQWDFKIDFKFPEIDHLVKQVEAIFIDDNQTSGKIIRGRWGTGKTHFRKYLRDIANKKKALFIESSMGRISNVYEDKNSLYKKLIHAHTNPSLRFLTAFFISAEENNFLKDIPILNYKKYNKSMNYIEDYFKVIFKKFSYLILFIDEMEELIERSNANIILQDLASIFHEEEMNWGANKDYGGKIKIFLSCTPQAYEKLRINPKIEQNLGKIEGRMKFLELPVFYRESGLKFIISFFKYYFDDDNNYPFDSISTLHSIVFYSRRNFRNLLDLLSIYLREFISKSNTDTIEIPTSVKLFDFYLNKNFHIQVTNESKIPLINRENYENILKYLKRWVRDEENFNRYKLIFKILLSNIKPISLKEISLKCDLEGLKISENEIQGIINNINEYLNNYFISNLKIIKYNKIDEDQIEYPAYISFNNILSEILNKDFEIKKNIIKIKNKKEIYLNEFKELFIFYKFSSNFNSLNDIPELKEEIFFPSKNDISEYENIFPGIPKEKIETMIKKLEVKAEKEEDPPSLINYYMLNHNLLFLIYPEPIPSFLSYFKNYDLIQKILEESKNNFEKYSKEHLTEIYSDYIKFIYKKPCKVTNINSLSLDSLTCSELRLKVIYNHKNIPINVWLIFLPAFNELIVEEISNLYKEHLKPNAETRTSYFPHFIVFISHQKFPNYIKLNKYFKFLSGTQIKKIQTTQEYIRKFVLLYIIKEKELIDERIYNIFNSEDIKEIDLAKLIEDSLNELESNNKINDIFLIKNLINIDSKKFISILSWFINMNANQCSLEEIIDWNKENVRHYILYGTKGLSNKFNMRDIESKRGFKEIESLYNMNFIEKHLEDRYSLKLNPIEKRILKILEYIKKNFNIDNISTSYLKKYFIIPKDNELLEELYIKTLQRRGKVYLKNNNIFYYNIKDLRKNIKEISKEIIKILSDIKISVIFSQKQREIKFIEKEKIINFLNQNFEDINSSEILYCYYLVAKYIREDIVKYFKEGNKKIKEILSEMDKFNYTNINDFFSKIKKYIKIKQNQSSFNLEDNIEELKENNEYKKNIIEILKDFNPYREQYIKNFRSYKNKYFEKAEKAKAFIPQYDLINEIFDKYKKNFDDVNDFCKRYLKEIIEFDREINEKRNQIFRIINGSFNNYNFQSELIKITEILTSPINIQIDINTRSYPFDKLKEQIKDNIISKMDSHKKAIDKYYKTIKNFKETKDKYEKLEESNKKVNILKKRITIENHQDFPPLDNIENKFRKFNYNISISDDEKYQSFIEQFSIFIIGINNYIRNLEEIYKTYCDNINKNINILKELIKEIYNYKNIDKNEKIKKKIQEIIEKHEKFIVDVNDQIKSIENILENNVLEDLKESINPLIFIDVKNQLESIKKEIEQQLTITDEEILKVIPEKNILIGNLISILKEKFSDRVEYTDKEWRERIYNLKKNKKVIISRFVSKPSINNDKKSQNQGKDLYFILDGSNIARNRTNSREANLKDVIRVKNKLMEYNIKEDNIYIIFSASLRYYLPESQLKLYNNLIQKENVTQAPAKTDDDWFILNFAKNKKAYIISNDQYKEYLKNNQEFQELENKIITYLFLEDQLIFDKKFNQLKENF
ncbi:MAG: NYN domain-containing protein [Promethearchaeota archaeon]